MKALIKGALRALGLDLVRYPPRKDSTLPPDITASDRAIIERIEKFTMTGVERQVALIESVRHIARHKIEGCIVECGVWRGGSSMAAALTLLEMNDARRDLYLYDTFEGMPPPQEVDRALDGISARAHLDRDPARTGSIWAVAGIDDVRQNMASTGYPSDRVKYVTGPVETTIPALAPSEPIALLRLDTDWYESTKHELEHLFPRLCKDGILIIDDYGHWEGARKAVDEYLASLDRRYYLHRIDYTGRLLVKG
jgi:O-methyltransferase